MTDTSTTAVIELITGINGSGKTLWGLQHVEALRKATGRTVYYWGIRGIKEAGVLTDWVEISGFDESGLALKGPDPEELHKLPEGAIIFIDEAQAVFPKGGKGPEPPGIAAFATSRWRGHTWFITTQHGADLNLFLRRRVGKHHHFVRAFGLERSTHLEWQSYARVESTTDRKLAIKSDFPFPKEVYDWYKSADTHSVQKQLPWKELRVFIILPFALILIGLFVWWRLNSAAPETEQPVSTEPAVETQQPSRGSPRLDLMSVPQEGPAWVAQFVERVKGQPMSARFYDSEIKPKTFPKISGCMEIITPDFRRCSCNTQQGTTITTMTTQECQFYLANGWFDFSKPDGNDEDRRTHTSSNPGQPAADFGALASSAPSMSPINAP